MNKIYSWAMRNSSPILFGLAAFLFVVGIGQVLAEFRDAVVASNVSTVEGVPVSQRAMNLLMALSGFLRAGSSAVWPLAAAAALYRWDRYQQTDKGGRSN